MRLSFTRLKGRRAKVLLLGIDRSAHHHRTTALSISPRPVQYDITSSVILTYMYRTFVIFLLIMRNDVLFTDGCGHASPRLEAYPVVAPVSADARVVGATSPSTARFLTASEGV